MSWTDKNSIKVIKYLRDLFKVKEFVETGTFKGINAKLHSVNFEKIFTCENNIQSFEIAMKRLGKMQNVRLEMENSPLFLEKYCKSYIESNKIDPMIFYLDAHFYDPKLPEGNGKFVVLKELESLKGFKNCIIIIHDFDNNLGHINYDGISLNFDLIGKLLMKVNPEFYFYTNQLSSCDIVKPDLKSIQEAGLEADEDTLENLEYAWKEPRLTYRGILYCVPKELQEKELKELGLVKLFPTILHKRK